MVPDSEANELLLGKDGVPAAAAAAAAVRLLAFHVHKVGRAAKDDGDEREQRGIEACLVKGALAPLARVDRAQLECQTRTPGKQ